MTRAVEPTSERWGEGYDLAPGEAAPRRRFEVLVPASRPPIEPASDARPIAGFDDPRRYTLHNLLLVLTSASFVLAAGIRMPRPLFAGVLGGAALVTAFAAGRLKRTGATLELAWWTLLVIYLMSSAFALRQD